MSIFLSLFAINLAAVTAKLSEYQYQHHQSPLVATQMMVFITRPCRRPNFNDKLTSLNNYVARMMAGSVNDVTCNLKLLPHTLN